MNYEDQNLILAVLAHGKRVRCVAPGCLHAARMPNPVLTGGIYCVCCINRGIEDRPISGLVNCDGSPRD
jgi:hypothetical protein